jgi:hypothetical protein
MRRALTRHPESLGTTAIRVEVEAVRTGASVLLLNYFAIGELENLIIPTEELPVRADGLWQRTCFEAFVRAAGSAYYEFNFAPSLQWAAYRFDGYREGMTVAREIEQPHMEVQSDESCLQLQVVLDLAGLANLRQEDVWRLVLSAVIEEASGHKSYWALAHPVGKPDFHHSDGFVLEL